MIREAGALLCFEQQHEYDMHEMENSISNPLIIQLQRPRFNVKPLLGQLLLTPFQNTVGAVLTPPPNTVGNVLTPSQNTVGNKLVLTVRHE